MNYYAFHIGDYAVHTRHLSLMEDLAYRRLLDLYYTREEALPSEVDRIARLIGMRDNVADVEAVLREFFTQDQEGFWSHSRCETEIASAKAKADQARANGAKGGRPKKPTEQPDQNPQKTNPVSGDNPEETGSQAPNPNPNPNPNPTSLAPNGACPPASDDPRPVRYAVPDCPMAEIVDLYHEQCPTLPRVEVLNDHRRGMLRSRWREVCAEQKFSREDGLGWWRDFFAFCAESLFLTGRTKPKAGSAPFLANFEWLIGPKNFAKVIERHYHREMA